MYICAGDLAGAIKSSNEARANETQAMVSAITVASFSPPLGPHQSRPMTPPSDNGSIDEEWLAWLCGPDGLNEGPIRSAASTPQKP